MKLVEIIEHNIVPKEKQKSKVVKRNLKMKRKKLPFTKGAFKELINPTGGKRIRNPVGGKVLMHI